MICGGEGFDVLQGGRGNDTFIYKSIDDAPYNYNNDRSITKGEEIRSFQSGKDEIDLSAIEIPDKWKNEEWNFFSQYDYLGEPLRDWFENPTGPAIITDEVEVLVYVTGNSPDMRIKHGYGGDQPTQSDFIL